MVEKVTVMKLKVDLQCCTCYKKVKKVLCKFPQIREQVYDEKQNIVTIAVICCSPEKMRDKLRCKGCGVIEYIEIVPPPPPPPCRCCPPPCRCCPPPCHCCPPPKRKPCPHPIPIGVCCEPCSEGRPGGPCFDGRPPCYVRPVNDGYGCCRSCYMGRCEVYICEENPSACTIV